MGAEPSHVQLVEYQKEVIPYINWMMEDIFCRYGVSIPYFLLEFDFPDYPYQPAWLDTNGYQFNINWGSWGYYLPWFNELLGLAFDEADLPRWQFTPWDMPPWEMPDWKFPTWEWPPLPEWPDLPEDKRQRRRGRWRPWTAAVSLAAKLGIAIPLSIDFSFPDWTAGIESGIKLGIKLPLPIGAIFPDKTMFPNDIMFPSEAGFPESTIKGKISAQLGIEAPMFTEATVCPKFADMLNERMSAFYESVAKVFTATKRTTSGYNYFPALDVSGTKIYYVYRERVPTNGGYDYSIWTASLDTDGTNWSTTEKRTSIESIPYQSSIQVSGTTIHYVWSELVGSYYQIFVATMGTNGTGWTVTQKTTSNGSKLFPFMRLSGTKLYYAWRQTRHTAEVEDYGIYTASMDTDGSNWSASYQHAGPTAPSHHIRFQIVGSTIYYVWTHVPEAGVTEIWTATMATNGTGWAATRRRINAVPITANSTVPLVVSGDYIYYTWAEKDGGGIYQVWTARMGTDGSGWSATKQTSFEASITFIEADLWVVNSLVHSVFMADSGTEFYTTETNIDGTGWAATKRIDTAYRKANSEQEVVSSSHYYIWAEIDDDSNYQIWTGVLE